MTDRTLISKQELRRRAAAVRDALSPAEIEAKSRAIMERLFALPAFERARTVAFFASFRSEVRTEPMMTGALAAGKQVAVPRVQDGAAPPLSARDPQMTSAGEASMWREGFTHRR